MTEHRAPERQGQGNAATQEPEKPKPVEYPKAMYRETEEPSTEPAPEMIAAADKKAEDEARAEGFTDGPDFQKKQAEKAKQAKHEKTKK